MRNHFEKNSRVVKLALAGLLLGGAPAALAQTEVLAVDEVIQEQNQWCWAGVSRSVLLYYGQDIPQCEIAEYNRTVSTWHDFGDVDCCVDPGQGCNYWNYFWGTSGSIEDILDHWGLATSTHSSVLNGTEVGGQVASFKPFIFRWGWSSGGGHFLVGHGLVGDSMYYMDPWFGEGHNIADYDWVVSNYSHTWTSTLTMNTSAPCVCATRDECCDGCRPFPDGTACDDGNQCTGNDACQAGVCAGTPVAEGTACDDGNACTQSDSCQSGICVGDDPVECLPSDQCHLAGVCDPDSGQCSDPPADDGTACDDANLCTQLDTCQSGACTGSDEIECVALDQCHVAGTCDPDTGLCSDPEAQDGTACDDSDLCTQVDTCQAGVCTGSDPIECQPSDQCHVAGSCDPETGLCSDPAAEDGTACDDGNGCTQVDTCQAGVCTGSDEVVCQALDQCHLPGICDPASGLCSNPEREDGSACDDGNLCTQTDSCQSGVCTGSDEVVCGALDQCHLVGTCDPATGLCSDPAQDDGTACDDGNACTQTDTCQSGACTGDDPVVCTASDQCHLAGTCDPATGLCSDPAQEDGTACDDGNACTRTDTCQQGVCTGFDAVVCTALDQCHLAGICDPETGECSDPFAKNGTACDDGNVCTQLDTCQQGVCHGTDPLSCDDGDKCTSDTCDPEQGCVYTRENCGCSCSAASSGGNRDILVLLLLCLTGFAIRRVR